MPRVIAYLQAGITYSETARNTLHARKIATRMITEGLWVVNPPGEREGTELFFPASKIIKVKIVADTDSPAAKSKSGEPAQAGPIQVPPVRFDPNQVRPLQMDPIQFPPVQFDPINFAPPPSFDPIQFDPIGSISAILLPPNAVVDSSEKPEAPCEVKCRGRENQRHYDF